MRAPVGEDKERMPGLAQFVDLLDENKLAEGDAYFDLNDLEISPGTGLLAYSLDTVSRRQYDIRFRDLSTDRDLPDKSQKPINGTALPPPVRNAVTTTAANAAAAIYNP